MIRLILILAALGILLLLIWRPSKRNLYQMLGYGGLSLAALGLIALLLTGRVQFLLGLLGAVFPLARHLAPLLSHLPLLRKLGQVLRQQKAQTVTDSVSTNSLQSPYVQLSINPQSGEMAGQVRAGPYRDRHLHELDSNTLLSLLAECRRHDPLGAALLDAYMERYHSHARQHSRDSTSANLSLDDAYQVLGLQQDAERQAVIDAHRRLIQRIHPDRGGSDYLAARINEAKEVILASLD